MMWDRPLPANTRAHPYRGLSVQEVDVPLTEEAILGYLDGREVYRRTDFLALRHGGATALVEVRKASLEPLFSPVVAARVISGPDDTAWVERPEVDVGNATALAGAAVPGAATTVVLGRFEHVNFIYRPAPIPVRVTEVVPPEPAEAARPGRAGGRVRRGPAARRADPGRRGGRGRGGGTSRAEPTCCRAGARAPTSGAPRCPSWTPDRPSARDWLLIGCERSLQFHRHFYGDEPERVDLCPRNRALVAAGKVLTKCCLIERGLEVDGDTAVVPWGANLDEVREGLRKLLL